MSSILKTTNIKHESSSSNNLVLGSDGNISITNTISAGTIGSSVAGNWGLKLLETYNVSGSTATFDMGSASIFSSTYDTYKIIFNDVSFNSNSNFRVQFTLADTGLVDSGSDYDFTTRGFSSNNDQNQGSSDIADFIALNSFVVKSVGSAIQGACGEITIPNPSATSTAKFVYGIISYLNSNSFTTIATFAGGLAQDAENAHQKPLVGIRFAQDGSNTYTRGTFRLYGVINA